MPDIIGSIYKDDFALYLNKDSLARHWAIIEPLPREAQEASPRISDKMAYNVCLV